MTAALAAVLCGLGAFTLWGTSQTSRATDTQSQALELDAVFSEARNAVAVQEMHASQYRVEPSVASRDRYRASAAVADEALRGAMELSSGEARADALRLSTEQAAYRRASDRLMDLVTQREDQRANEQHRLEVTPAYYTLQTDIDQVSRAYHSEAQRLVTDLRQLQTRIFITTGVGFALGLTLVAMIWRVMLGYQRRLLEFATASQHLALHDPLTGLANRALFARRLGAALDAARADPGQRLAVMQIDLNGFKGVNDTLGHQAGDELLIETGQRLQAALREGDTVARLGGDEFAVLLPTVATIDSAKEIAERATGALRRTYVLPAGSAAVSGSVGLVLGPDSADAEDILRYADAAMYRAKKGSKGLVVYDPKVDTDRPGEMELLVDLRALLDGGAPVGELVLYYQPHVRLADGTVTGAEALVRWQHPQLGLLPPATLLPVAANSGLETTLTYRLLRMAVREAARWHATARPLVVSVNVSPICLLDEGFVREVRSTLAECGLLPSLLRLEITENGVMTDPVRALSVLRSVQQDGVQVSIDDFGTGFSSLSQLKRLTANELKIDQAFIKDLARDPGDAILVRAAIDLAHNLGLLVTAEGVEDLDALVMLHELGCDQAQGFALARPVPADELMHACLHAEKVADAALRRSTASWSSTPRQ